MTIFSHQFGLKVSGCRWSFLAWAFGHRPPMIPVDSTITPNTKTDFQTTLTTFSIPVSPMLHPRAAMSTVQLILHVLIPPLHHYGVDPRSKQEFVSNQPRKRSHKSTKLDENRTLIRLKKGIIINDGSGRKRYKSVSKKQEADDRQPVENTQGVKILSRDRERRWGWIFRRGRTSFWGKSVLTRRVFQFENKT